MAKIKISQLAPKGSNLSSTDLIEVSSLSGSTYNSKKITGQELIDGVLSLRSLTINGTTQDLSANRTFTVTDANLSTSDVTTNDVSITKHGFAPKAPNDITKFLRGDGTWAVAGAASGVWGISNASGVYTYYATLTLAMAAASSRSEERRVGKEC